MQTAEPRTGADSLGFPGTNLQPRSKKLSVAITVRKIHTQRPAIQGDRYRKLREPVQPRGKPAAGILAAKRSRLHKASRFAACLSSSGS